MHFLIEDNSFIFAGPARNSIFGLAQIDRRRALFVGQFRPSSVRKRLRRCDMPPSVLFPAERLLTGF
ncbi:hypothetical protein E2553_31960 [Paraburkholderia dipogonis]|uniref:Uncharacterized protein n=1 Tax=Paraburkholderia dipogonis TaxID=1211383 RepID=A0A4Y8MV96_9BURK|nr:hypothetical protein [Paraburkholderia dipogonis]TFE41292.1 hypothetical protein E2553_31960 [Paraburkholderia dipogonis]